MNHCHHQDPTFGSSALSNAWSTSSTVTAWELNGDDYDCDGRVSMSSGKYGVPCTNMYICYEVMILQFAMNCDLCSLSCCRKQPAAAWGSSRSFQTRPWPPPRLCQNPTPFQRRSSKESEFKPPGLSKRWMSWLPILSSIFIWIKESGLARRPF